ncbi:MAG: metallophosphoesterase [Phycisphaerales bacterium]|nr:metallophosphoesterase [Phycisphaerales bacterium]
MSILLTLPLLISSHATLSLQDDPGSSTRTRVMEEERFKLDEDGRAEDGQIVAGTPHLDRSVLAILPDRTTGDDRGLVHLERAIRDLGLLRPDAVFCVGDLVQGYTRDLAAYDREVDDFLRIIGDLDADFWPTAGNHDVISGERDASDDRFAQRYRQRFGPLHYAVRLEHGTMVVLFSDEALDGGNVNISDEQIAWLERVLEQADASKPIVLLMHRPLWRTRRVDWETRVHPLLVEHGVDAVIAGHFHALQRDEDRDGIEYHLLGVCGGAIDQHPLTGQFNHLTLLDLGPGDEIHLRHLPVGVVLPDDFILRADQDLAYRLKSRRNVATVRGVLPDPRLGPVAEKISVEIRNPLDRTIAVSIEGAGPARPWIVDGHEFVARTPIHFENSATTDLQSPFRIVTPAPVEIEAGGRATIEVDVLADMVESPPPPPEIRITASFRDHQDRVVPIVLPRRIAVTRHDADATDGTPRWPIAAWTHSVYEELEPLGTMATTADPESGDLKIELEIDDDRLADDEVPIEQTIQTRRNPHGDVAVLTLRTDEATRSFLVEIGAFGDRGRHPLVEFDADGEILNSWPEAVFSHGSSDQAPTLHRFEIRVPEVPADTIRAIQVELADNDRSYHTQWRRLAPRGAMLEFGPSTPIPSP